MHTTNINNLRSFINQIEEEISLYPENAHEKLISRIDMEIIKQDITVKVNRMLQIYSYTFGVLEDGYIIPIFHPNKKYNKLNLANFGITESTLGVKESRNNLGEIVLFPIAIRNSDSQIFLAPYSDFDKSISSKNGIEVYLFRLLKNGYAKNQKLTKNQLNNIILNESSYEVYLRIREFNNLLRDDIKNPSSKISPFNNTLVNLAIELSLNTARDSKFLSSLLAKSISKKYDNLQNDLKPSVNKQFRHKPLTLTRQIQEHLIPDYTIRQVKEYAKKSDTIKIIRNFERSYIDLQSDPNKGLEYDTKRLFKNLTDIAQSTTPLTVTLTTLTLIFWLIFDFDGNLPLLLISISNIPLSNAFTAIGLIISFIALIIFAVYSILLLGELISKALTVKFYKKTSIIIFYIALIIATFSAIAIFSLQKELQTLSFLAIVICIIITTSFFSWWIMGNEQWRASIQIPVPVLIIILMASANFQIYQTGWSLGRSCARIVTAEGEYIEFEYFPLSESNNNINLAILDINYLKSNKSIIEQKKESEINSFESLVSGTINNLNKSFLPPQVPCSDGEIAKYHQEVGLDYFDNLAKDNLIYEIDIHNDIVKFQVVSTDSPALQKLNKEFRSQRLLRDLSIINQ